MIMSSLRVSPLSRTRGACLLRTSLLLVILTLQLHQHANVQAFAPVSLATTTRPTRTCVSRTSFLTNSPSFDATRASSSSSSVVFSLHAAASTAASSEFDPALEEDTSLLDTTASSSTTARQQYNDNDASLAPSYAVLMKFAATTVLIWLSEPLLSLVDCCVTGMFASSATTQLAALGPATTLTDSLLYLTYFLAIATTNQLASDLTEQNYRKLQTTTSHVMGVAVGLGLLVSAVVFAFGTPLLKNMAGQSATVELTAFAVKYTAIRATVAVAAVTGMVAQAFLLTVKDMKTPVVAVAAASVINVAGDLLLRKQGVAGAAIATAAACLASTAILMRQVRAKMNQWRNLEVLQKSERVSADMNVTQVDLADIDVTATFATATAAGVEPIHLAADILEIDAALDPETHKEIPLVSLPDRTAFIALCKLSGPIFFVMLAKIACYSAMTVKATDFGIVPLASHNIMMRIFFFFGCFGDSLSQTAQTFLPATLYPVPVPAKLKVILRRLTAMAVVVGVVNSQAAVWILKHAAGSVTKDAAIGALMRTHTGYFGLAILLHPFIMVAEGTVIASREFSNLLKTYAITVCMHFGMLKYGSGSFPMVWRTFFLFQLTRLVNFGYRVVQKSMSERREQQVAA